MKQQLFLITGVMASGKSTVAEALAGRFDRAVHLRGDVFRRMIVSGRVEMSGTPSDEALRQLQLRYTLAADVAKAYYAAGFTVVLQDNYYGQWLPFMVSRLQPLTPSVVVLCPDAETVRAREAGRGKTGYSSFQVEALWQSFMATTPRIGFWLDSAELTPLETVNQILAHYR